MTETPAFLQDELAIIELDELLLRIGAGLSSSADECLGEPDRQAAGWVTGIRDRSSLITHHRADRREWGWTGGWPGLSQHWDRGLSGRSTRAGCGQGGDRMSEKRRCTWLLPFGQWGSGPGRPGMSRGADSAQTGLSGSEIAPFAAGGSCGEPREGGTAGSGPGGGQAHHQSGSPGSGISRPRSLSRSRSGSRPMAFSW